MNTLDTNILARFFVKESDYEDHERQQREIAIKMMNYPSYIPITIILELVWVLGAVYHLTKENIHQSLKFLLKLPHFTLENADLVAQACDYYLQGMDFADALHFLKSPNSENFYTFDNNFIKKSARLNTTPPVTRPELA